ncbi:HlyD family secretion protein [Flavobacteriaceae bacterium M23B6Z8]
MRSFILILIFLLLVSCNGDEKSDAYGNFEATEITVSAKGKGELFQFEVKQGLRLSENEVVGVIDTIALHLDKLRLNANIEALDDKLKVAAPDIAILIEDRANLIRERDRTLRLFEEKAATQQQLDDYNGKIDLINQRISSTRRSTSISNRAVLAERKPLQAQIAIIDQQIKDHLIKSPITGTVLTRYAESGELVSQGAPLFSIANLETLTLRAYTSAALLQKVKLNDTVTVLVDDGKEGYQKHSGRVSWIADKAEFTPKTIETKEERVNLVYAIEVEVGNDGNLKIGMPGEIIFQNPL